MKILRRLRRAPAGQAQRRYDSAAAYQRHLDSKFELYGADRDLAFADAVGSLSVELFHAQGDAHVAVLDRHGLTDGMTVYDLGCGCGRTAQALRRSGWHGRYIGADIIHDFIDELQAKCPGYEGHVHLLPTLIAEDASLDMVYHWSVFTHIPPEECYLYLADSFRALKPGGKTIFSFIEITEPLHRPVFDGRVERIAAGRSNEILDNFLHKDWIATWAERIGFTAPAFTAGDDAAHHPAFWQTLAVMTKPG